MAIYQLSPDEARPVRTNIFDIAKMVLYDGVVPRWTGCFGRFKPDAPVSRESRASPNGFVPVDSADSRMPLRLQIHGADFLEAKMGWYDNKKPDKPGTKRPDEDVPQLLQDFRHVASVQAGMDKTEGHRDARAFKKENYAKFAAQLAAMEKEYRQEVEENEGKASGTDIGTAKCVELCEKLIADILAKQGAK